MKKIIIAGVCVAMGVTAHAGILSITTADGEGLDGSLIENHGGYTGNFDTTGGLTDYQYTDVRHYTPVLKWDLSSFSGNSSDITNAYIVLTSSGGGYTRTYNFMEYDGADSDITTSLLYDAANPFVDDAYVAETDVDDDFVNLTTVFAGSIAGSADLSQSVGSGDAALLASVQAAIDDDGFITFVMSGNNRPLYMYSAETGAASGYQPTLVIETIPEPATVGLMGVFGGAMVLLRRRFKR
ncbi:MAG: PEP-CTERM sorting domain-containing protein [Pontiellaceae bacterium]|nr:PEP-CTERM sorting domain-containing protein [Pontiellaceae bacterium]MBN2785135.1 PEP-CTERM sorting domain-containing protein [Pontiellaceae bacterium]